MKLTNSQQKILDSIEKKLKRTLEYYEENKAEGYRNILRLIIAERIRGTKHILPLKKIDIKSSEDARAKVAEAVSEKFAYKMARNIKEQQNLNGAILKYLKGRPREGDERRITKRRGLSEDIRQKVKKSLGD